MFVDDLVKLKIRKEVASDYLDAATFINENEFDFVIIEHEYGIYGGSRYGANVVCLLRSLSIPVVTTLHTIKKSMSDEEHSILQQFFMLSSKVVVMTQNMKHMLDAHHNLYGDRIVVIPHGVRAQPYPDKAQEKIRAVVDPKRPTMLGFGLIHPGKGYEHVIKAMPTILRQVPNILFMIYGKAHPSCGPSCSSYLQNIKNLVATLGLSRSVIFYDVFLSDKQLNLVLGATDLYLTPYKDLEQAVSGTVALSLSKGCVVASSRYDYANEVLKDGRGILFDDLSPSTISSALINILKDKNKLHEMSKESYKLTRDWAWNKIAQSMMNLIT
ncbi:hypothetical protein AKO1_015020 [Acrasis kona]|uniref:Glycosyltransferase n=1 Tax=Acrasis kona TaxID=1008807 RepID=A0AAW2Z127_9EUKA